MHVKQREEAMPHLLARLAAAGIGSLIILASLGGPVHAQRETSLSELLAGSTVAHTIKLKELTPEWRRLTLTGDMMGTGWFQSLMQGLNFVLAAGAGDVIYSRGALLRIGDQQFLVGYRLPSQGVDVASLAGMAAEAIGGGGEGRGEASMPERKPLTPESDLSLALVNVRAITSISDVRPFNLDEALKPPPPGLMDTIFRQAKEKAEAATAVSHAQQLAVAVVMYVQDQDGMLPPMETAEQFQAALMPYVRKEEPFQSPATDKPFRPNPRLSGRKLAGLGNPAGLVIFYSSVPEPDGTRIVGRADGSVKTISAEEWVKVVQAHRLPEDSGL